MSITSNESSPTAHILQAVREDIDSLAFPLRTPSQSAGAELSLDVAHQLDDYLLPRYASVDAPLLGVIGGSTGSGKSALINALVRQSVARSSAIRPTTRRPLLIHNRDDAVWFDDQRILPGLARVKREDTEPVPQQGEGRITEIETYAAERMPRGLALLDSPDIDSVIAENRQLAAQLLSAADLWIFVTTAARYADAIPWAILDDAANRNIVVAVVLNRVPPGVGAEVRADLAQRMRERGLEEAPLFMVAEQPFDDDGLIAFDDVAPIMGWLEGLAHDAGARATVVRQTLSGAVATLNNQLYDLADAYDEQLDTAAALTWDVTTTFDQALNRIDRGSADGTLLRGEVLSRWQDVVGAGEWSRKIETGVAKFRDRLTGIFKPQSRETAEVEGAIEEGLHQLILQVTNEAIADVIDSWKRMSALNIDGAVNRLRSEEERSAEAEALVRTWQSGVLEMVRTEGADKKSTARALALGVNAVGVALIIVIFASTGGLVGGEVAVAGGTAVVAQRLLEAVFGDDAVRRMSARARNDLHDLTQAFLDRDRLAFISAVNELGLNVQLRESIRNNAHALEQARTREGM